MNMKKCISLKAEKNAGTMYPQTLNIDIELDNLTARLMFCSYNFRKLFYLIYTMIFKI